jgi:hypothetical protein
MDNTVGSLTQEQKSIIIGTLLGDGYIRIIPGRKNAFLEVNHSISEKEYVDWKCLKLRTLVKSFPKKRRGKKGRIAYRFFTRQHPKLTELYKKFYQDGKKSVSELKLNSLILAVWFMDDGSRSGESYYLNTQRFDLSSQKRLVKMLEDQFKIRSSLNRDKKYYRIRIRSESAERFKKLIEKHVIPTMKYKLG